MGICCMAQETHTGALYQPSGVGWGERGAAKSLQSCPTLCDPIDGSPTGSPVPGILQARTLEWVAISFSNACKWKVKGKSLSRVRLFVTPWTAAHRAPPSMGFSRQEYWSGVPSPPPNLSPGNSKKGSPQVELIYAYGTKVAYGQIHTSWRACPVL